MAKNLVEFKNLKTYFHTSDGVVKAVNDVSFKIKEGETVCVVGESGCGKSVTAMSLMRLIPTPPGKIEGGEILFEGKDILKLTEAEMRNIRGNDVSVIFQEPMTSLNPVFRVGDQICEAIILHQKLSKEAASKKAIEVLKIIGIPRAEEIMKTYPHELSGGMRQRVMIAMAVSCNPKLLIADYVVVMYAGKIIEEAPAEELFKNPLHPYTVGLLKSKPVLNKESGNRLYSIPGQVPNPIGMPDNCYFSSRCDKCMKVCKDKQPHLINVNERHKVACWLYEEGK